MEARSDSKSLKPFLWTVATFILEWFLSQGGLQAHYILLMEWQSQLRSVQYVSVLGLGLVWGSAILYHASISSTS